MTWESETVTHYGYTFKVTDKHMTPEEMVPLQYSYDELGAKALEALDKISPPLALRSGEGWSKTMDAGEKAPAPPARDNYALLRDNVDKDEVLKQLWDEVTVVPDWVDWEQIQRGQEVLYRYAGPALLAFALHGLIGSAGASSRPAETLVRTGGHSVKVAKRRFFETFQLLLEVTKSLESVQPGGAGHMTVVRVRLLHATVRQRILKLASQRPGYFSVEKQGGMPINDLDAIQSVCAFSVDLLYLGLPAQGIYVRPQEAADYIALWRWVGYVIGAPVDYMATPEMARAAMESAMTNCINPSPNSKILSGNIIKALDGVSPIYAPKEWWAAGGRFVNGDELSDALGLQKTSLYYWVLMRCQALVFKSMAYISRSIPFLDQWMIETSRRVIWDYAIEGEDGLGAPSKFEFKYVPDLNERTGTKAEEAQKEGKSKNMGIESLVIYATLFEVVAVAVMVSVAGLTAHTALGYGMRF